MTSAPPSPHMQSEHELLIQQLYRLLRLGNMHDVKNQAVQRSLEVALPALKELISSRDGELKILFAQKHIFISGQPLKANRHVYEQANELGELFVRHGYNELTLRDGLQHEELSTFVERVARSQQQNKQLFHPPHGAIEIRQLDTTLLVGLDDDTLTPEERVIRTCTTTLVVMDRLYEHMRHGDYSLVRHVKRLARDLVILAEDHPGTLLSFVASASNRSDPAMLATKGAILSILTAKRLTRDLRNLADLAMTALLYDAGVVRACGLLRHAERRGLEFMPKLSEDAADRLPEASATMMSLFGRLNEASLSRGVYSYESHFIRRRHTRGFPYQGKLAPTIEALVLALVRRYLELISLDLQRDDYQHGPDQAIDILASECPSKLEQIILQLFLISIGLYRPGTAVRLTSGAVGIVISNHKRPSRYARPKLLLVYDAHKKLVSPPAHIDLSEVSPHITALGKIETPLRSQDPAILAARNHLRQQVNLVAGADPNASSFGFEQSLAESSEINDSSSIPLGSYASLSMLEQQPKRAIKPVPTATSAPAAPSPQAKPALQPAPQPQPQPQPPAKPPEPPPQQHPGDLTHNPALMSFGAVPVAAAAVEEDLPELTVYPLIEEPDQLGDSPSFAQEVLTSAPKNPRPHPQPPQALDDEDSELDQTQTSNLDHTGVREGTDRIEVVNINNLAHLFPASFSELDEKGLPQALVSQPQPHDDDEEIITSISHTSTSASLSSPQTWDSSLDNLPPSMERSELGVLDPDALDDDEEHNFEATTLLPRSVIAIFQSRDRHHANPELDDPAPAARDDDPTEV